MLPMLPTKQTYLLEMKADENEYKLKWDTETFPVYRCHTQLHMNSKEVFLIGSTM